MSKEELLKYLIAEIDLIMHDKDYRFENANGTWYSRESCRDLTNEEVFEELRTELRQFADLEAKLEESEKKFIVANNLRKNSDEVLLNYKTKKYGLDKTIQELRKMKLSLPEKEWYYKGFENCERQMSSHIADLTLEIKKLKQQLAEKDGQLRAKIGNMKSNDFIKMCLQCGLMIDAKEKDQDKISFAIKQLEKVKEWCEDTRTEDEFGVFTINVDDELNTEDNLLNFIDNQINELKGEE